MRRNKFSIKKNDWKKTEKYNLTIALYILITKNQKIYPAYVLKHNSNREKQIIFFKDLKQRKTLGLSCSKNTISIIKRNNV